MIQFLVVQVSLGSTGPFSGTAVFTKNVISAEVALRSLNLPTYNNGPYHYRGPTIVQITKVTWVGSGVTFTFNYNFSESPDYFMVGSIDFLVIADVEAN